MPLFIPDASVILAFLLAEDDFGKAAYRFFQDYREEKLEIVLPEIWFYEVSNRLSKPKNKKEEELQKHVLWYKDSFLKTVSLNEKQVQRAFALVKKYPKISFYDAAYHSLALELKGTFLTADERYFKIAKNEKRIKLLKDY